MSDSVTVDGAAMAAAARPEPRFKRVHIIVNPASGQDRPVLSILNDAFNGTGIDWDVMMTKEAGDGRRYALAEDLTDLVPDVMRHRLVLSYEALVEEITADALIQKVLKKIPPPDKPLAHSADEARTRA